MWQVKVKFKDGRTTITRHERMEDAMKTSTAALGENDLMYVKISPPK